MRIDAWQVFGTPLLIVAVGLGCGKSTDRAASGGASSEAADKASDPSEVDPSIRVSEAEAQQFAEEFAAAINQQNVPAAAAMFDWDETVRRAAEGVELSEKAVRNFGGGATEALSDNLVQQVTGTVKQGRRYELLRVHLGRGGRRALFRLSTIEGFINYHDIVIYRDPGGKLKVADMYIAVSGELLSETFRRGMIQLAAHENRSILQRLSGAQADFIKYSSEMQQMTGHAREGRHAEALAVYQTLPPSMQQDKSLLIVRIVAAQNVSDAEYAAAINDLLKYHPDDPSAGLFMIDGATQKGDLDGALAGVDQLDKSVGGDPYLDLMRANLLVEKKDHAKARQHLAKLETWNSQLVDTQWVYVAISLAEKNHDETARLLNKVADEFGIEIQDLTAIPEYADFVKSPQYEAWMKSRAAAP